jgi:hypothetical protein
VTARCEPTPGMSPGWPCTRTSPGRVAGRLRQRVEGRRHRCRRLEETFVPEGAPASRAAFTRSSKEPGKSGRAAPRLPVLVLLLVTEGAGLHLAVPEDPGTIVVEPGS